MDDTAVIETIAIDPVENYSIHQAGQDFARLAVRLSNTPMGIVILSGRNGSSGLFTVGWKDSSAASALPFYQHLKPRQTHVLVVPDTLADHRFSDHPSTLADPPVRSYLGAPIVAQDGRMLGSVSTLDYVPRRFSPEQQEALRILAHQIATWVEMQSVMRLLYDKASEVQPSPDGLPRSQYQMLFEYNPHPMWVVDRSTFAYLAVNLAAINIYGYPREDFLRMTHLDIHPPEDVPFIKEYHNEHSRDLGLHDSMAAAGTWRHRKRDGTIITVDMRWNPILFNGRDALIIQAQDITHRKQMEAALRESESRFRALIEATFDGIAIHHQGIIIECNPGLADMFGYRLEDMQGKSMLEVIAPESHSLMASKMMAGHEDRLEIIGLKADGRRFNLELVARSHTFKGLDVRLVALRDITHLKLAQKKLRESEARFRAIFSGAALGIALVDRHGRVVECNPALQHMLGYSEEELRRQCFIDWTHPEDAEADWQSFESLMAGLREEYRIEKRYLRKDSQIMWGEVTVSLVRGASGEPRFCIRMIKNITDFKNAEAERRRLEEQFLQSQKVEAVGRLAGGVAHDFNNLLTTISGHCDLLLSKLPSPDPLHVNAREILKAAEQASALTRQLLTFSHKQTVQPRIIDLNAIVTDMQDMLGRLIGENIDLVKMLEPSVELVKADPNQIKQVIMNLVVNARDALSRGGRICIRTDNAFLVQPEADAAPGAYVMVSVEDNGHGMNEEIKAHLFEPFFTTKKPGKGTGLGLATCYGIVKQGGGHIKVQSQPGEGTTIAFFLPRVQQVDEEPLPQQSPTDLPRGNEVIMVVEDSTPVRQLAVFILRNLGYTVLEAADGEDALRIVEQNPGTPIDLLFTDIIMPQMGGQELADRFAAMSPNTRVLYTTGYTDNISLQHDILESEIDFLPKPFTPALLAQKVRQILSS